MAENIKTLVEKIAELEGGMGSISPCGGKTWEECLVGGYVWYNTADHSTHLFKVN